MSITDEDPQNRSPAPGLVLLKSEAPSHPQRISDASDSQPRLRVIDCRPSLVELLSDNGAGLRLREVTERLLGRFAAFVAAKIRR